MSDMTTYQRLIASRDEKGGGLIVLIDPDRMTDESCLALAESASSCGADAILVGTSFMLGSRFETILRMVKDAISMPVIIFPGSSSQVSPVADAILFTSLVSGRNPTYLIEEQVKGAPQIKACNLEPIPTGYMLIESGNLTSVQYISGTMPIPRTKHDIACAHALACQYLGMKLVYLEAGSGATEPVLPEMVRAVSSYIDIPVLVGGGITTPEICAQMIASGASFVVVGNVLEGRSDVGYLRELAAAAHPREAVVV